MNKFTKLIAMITTILAMSFGSVMAAHAANHKVDIASFKFSVAELSIKAGDTITWTNKDGAPHTATALDGSWTTKTLQKGQSETIKVTANMALEYRCNIHRNMKAKLKM
uniref:Copper-binding protein n=1 Tax=OCS116 cluster bacterium TaxID=2030921 RepID=A0A2A4Z2K7_9PROT